jgi:divalent metal cation (Fe/Co/Zn/Cd) transporter
VYAAVSSLSLSLLETGIDSVFDVGSNILLFWLHRKAAKLDVNIWPVGGARLETIGNIVYGNPIHLQPVVIADIPFRFSV